MKRLRIFLLTACAGAVLACGQDGVEVYKAPKETNAPRAAGPVMDIPPAAHGAPLHWKLPAGWKELPGSGMRLATLVVPGKGSPDAEVSVVVLPGPAGGDLSNINRWRGQLGLEAIDEAGLSRRSQRVKSPAGTSLVVDLEGSMEGRKARMLASILSAGGQTWFFKLTADPAAVEPAKPAFIDLLKSLHPPQ